MSTAMREMVREISVNPISFEPISAALNGVSPSSMWRAMFSIITIASSTTKPVAMVSAMRVRLLTEKPARYITPKVPISERGTTMLGITVAGMFLRNRNVTRTTSPMAKTSSCCTSRTDARMVSVRLLMTSTRKVDGRLAVSVGSS